jgi:DNA-binding NtrC family response regulator
VIARILIVDDEPVLRRTFERALRPLGYEVDSVGDAHLAYELLDAADHDLVLLDIHLPGLAGDALYLALVRRWPRLMGRVVLMTGDPGVLDREWPTELRRCPVLFKPFGLDALQRSVAEALERAGVEQPKRKRNGG